MRIVEEKSSLLGNANSDAEKRDIQAKLLHRNFLIVSILISCNLSSTFTSIAYANSEFGYNLGHFATGFYLLTLIISALLLSKPIIAIIGPKNTILIGLTGSCIYLFTYLVSIFIPSVAWFFFNAGAISGGIGNGLLWVAYGRYFTLNSKIYSSTTNLKLFDVHSTFSSTFTTIFLASEMIFKVLTTVIFILFEQNGEFIGFLLNFGIAVGTTIIFASVSELEEYGSWLYQSEVVTSNIYSVGRLIYEDSRLTLLIPYQISYGFITSFVNFYVFGTIIAESSNLGIDWIAFLATVVLLIGSTVAIPTSWFTKLYDKKTVLLASSFIFIILSLFQVIFSDKTLGSLFFITIYLILYAIGTSIWVRFYLI